MSRRRRGISDQRGLVGKAVIVLLILVVVLGLAAVEGGSILFSRIQLQGVADDAATSAAASFRDTRNARQACHAAVETIGEHDQSGTLTRCAVTPQGTVTLVMRKEASTLIVQRVSWLRKLGIVKVTSTARPPSL